MLRFRDKQVSFIDAGHICDSLIPQDNFYRKFKEIIWPLVQDQSFEEMYTLDNGRPAIPPSLLAMATILQFYRNLSDREMERACMYDLEIKYALGLRVDQRLFDHSSLGDFRKRLLDHGKEKEVFDKILGKLVESGLVKKDEIQRIDATHIIADIAVPTVVTLVKKGIFEILKSLNKHHREILSQIQSQIDLSEYAKNKVNDSNAGKDDRQRRERRLVKVVNDALTILKYTNGITGDKILTRRVEYLRRILHENMEINRDGEARERDDRNQIPDKLISPIDPDARYGAKSKTKKFVGFKAQVSQEIGNQFITNIKAMPGNQRDGGTMVDTIMEQKEQGISPVKVIADSAYGDAAYRKTLQENNIQLVAPLRIKNDYAQGVYPKSMFHYDKEKQKLICPEGKEGVVSYFDRRKEIVTFHFSMIDCKSCASKVFCTRSQESRRCVGIGMAQEALSEAEQYNLTAQFREEMKLRPPIEGKLSELKRYHGLVRARYRGLAKLNLQCCFTAVAVNIKRWIKLILQRLQSPPLVLGAA